MSIYYKVDKNSEFGEKLNSVLEKRHKCFDAAKKLCEKYRFHQYRGAYWCYFGGISACIQFDETPDPKLWKKVRYNEYMPKKNSKEGKAIQQEIEALPIIHRMDINKLFGLDIFSGIGLIFSHPQFIGLEFGTEKEHTPTNISNDLIEITHSEYNSLNTSKKRKRNSDNG